MSSGAVTVRSATDPEAQALVDDLVDELESFAFERERVLAKLDIRAAQQARRIAREVRVVVRGLPIATDDVGRDDVMETLGQLLVEAHRLLEGEMAADVEETCTQSGQRAIEDLRDAAPAIQSRPTRAALETVPIMVYEDDDDGTSGLDETIARRGAWERSGNRILGR